MLVRELVRALFDRFPKERACEWDRPGLTVGDPDAEVVGVACALDPTPGNVRAAAAAGCNVLLTHHPAWRGEGPGLVTPTVLGSSMPGAVCWQAARHGVSVVGMHTNLDVSDEALDLACERFGLPRVRRLEEPDGFGVVMDAGGLTVGELAERLAVAYGCQPTVWGDASAVPGLVAFSSGSLGELGLEAARQGIRLVVSGEGGYHRVQEGLEMGCAAILLGHDASELPYACLLARIVSEVDPEIRTKVLDESLRWHVPATKG